MSNQIHILGAGKLAECVIDLIVNEKKYSTVNIYDDHIKQVEIAENIFPVQGSLEKGKEEILKSSDDFLIALGVNNRELALEILNDFVSKERVPANIISDRAIISASAKIGVNAIIFPAVYVGCKVEIADLFLCYSNASIEHHIKIGNGVVVCPGVNIASNVSIGNKSFIGIGSTISNSVEIGEDAVIGAGAVVVASVAHNHLATGVPSINKLISNKIIF